MKSFQLLLVNLCLLKSFFISPKNSVSQKYYLNWYNCFSYFYFYRGVWLLSLNDLRPELQVLIIKKNYRDNFFIFFHLLDKHIVSYKIKLVKLELWIGKGGVACCCAVCSTTEKCYIIHDNILTIAFWIIIEQKNIKILFV